MRYFRIGLAGVVMLVLLRLTIGWHFLYQGMSKLDDPEFSSTGFLSQAKGPLAEQYHALVPDFWGRERLNVDKAIQATAEYRKQFGETYPLTAEQVQIADRLAEMRSQQIKDFFAENKEPLETYFHELDRLAAVQNSPARYLEYQQKRNWDQHKKLQTQVKLWVEQLDRWEDLYHEELASLTKEPPKPGALAAGGGLTMDRFITYSNIAVGVCLMAGLLTRLAAFGGGLFLMTIVLAQPEWPGIYPPAPPAVGRSLLVTKEFIEMVAMFTLAALPVGRWAGLDFFIHYLFVRPVLGKRNQTSKDSTNRSVTFAASHPGLSARS